SVQLRIAKVKQTTTNGIDSTCGRLPFGEPSSPRPAPASARACSATSPSARRRSGTVERVAGSPRPDAGRGAGSGGHLRRRRRTGRALRFLLPPQDIRAHLTARQRESEFHLPQGVEAAAGRHRSSVRGLFDWGKRLVDTAVQQPALFDEAGAERVAAQDELLETLLATLARGRRFRVHAQRPHAPGAEPHREGRRGLRARADRRSSLCDRPVPGRGGERAHAWSTRSRRSWD
ncbi:MAG: hypothetical protein MZW92_07900, partial [Comamonadaceae bacterium]|nr:hypothetical protein [Comamonadaceae bacterium]